MMQRKVFCQWVLFAICMIFVSGGYAAEEIKSEEVPLAPGYGKLGYELAEIGSYTLPPLKRVPDGNVLDEQGNKLSLHELYKGKYTLLSFIYSNCKDANGCPLAYVFYQLKSEMRNDEELADKLRLASLSFDRS